MRTRVERSKLRFITRRPWGAWRAIAFGAIARATSSLRPSAPRRRSREPPVGPRLGGPKIARRRPRALRRPKVPRLCHGNNNEPHSLGPPPAGPDFGASDPPPSGASVASPELRFCYEFPMDLHDFAFPLGRRGPVCVRLSTAKCWCLLAAIFCIFMEIFLCGWRPSLLFR